MALVSASAARIVVAAALAGAIAARAGAQPLSTGSINAEAYGLYGWSVGGVADANGDQRGDFIVGAINEDTSDGVEGAGRAYIRSGTTGSVLRVLVSPNRRHMGWFGWSVAGIGDVNNDGRGDVIISAPWEDVGPEQLAGRAYIYSGASGQRLADLKSPQPETLSNFGWAIAAAPDINGDGRDDVVVGDPFSGGPSEGRVHLFSGATGTFLRTLSSPNAAYQGLFGMAVAGIPDVDGDGRGDVIVGAPYEAASQNLKGSGRAYVMSGTTGLLITQLQSPTPMLEGRFGFAVGHVQNLKAGGVPGIVVSASREGPGCVYVYRAGETLHLYKINSPYPVNAGKFGFAVTNVPDINKDGVGDIGVSALAEGPGKCGRAYVFSGVSGLKLAVLKSAAQENGGQFGGGIAGVPDATKNGRGEVIVGAPRENPAGQPKDTGRAYLFKF